MSSIAEVKTNAASFFRRAVIGRIRRAEGVKHFVDEGDRNLWDLGDLIQFW